MRFLLGIFLSFSCLSLMYGAREVTLNHIMIADAAAQAPAIEGPPQAPPQGPPPAPPFGEVLFKMTPMLAMVFVIFYFMVVRPQNKKILDQQQLITGLKKGDGVITQGGVIGKVISVDNGSVTLEIARDVKVRFEKSSIVRKEAA